MRQITAQKLLEARKALGLSTRAVAERLSRRFRVSHATIANYEGGKSSPPLDILAALATLYERPLNWFLERGSQLTNVRYRNLTSKVRVADRHRYEAEAHRWLDAYITIERRLGSPLNNDFHGFRRKAKETPADVARRVRNELGLGEYEKDPIDSVIDVLHRFGVRVMELRTELRIDGLAARFDSEHAVILNPVAPNDRFRMNAAHELGHVVLGDCGRTSADKLEEQQAFEFASHLLLPNRALKDAFDGQSMIRLLKFKERYGISLAAMVYRAEKQRVITKPMARKLWIGFAKKGWKTTEPGDVRPDRATRFEELIDAAVADGRLSVRDAANIAAVRPEELRERVELASGVLPDDEPSILSLEGSRDA